LIAGLGEATSTLCLGPSLSGKREFLAGPLRCGASVGAPGLFVTTDADADVLLDQYPDAFPTD
jgi:KaiC/GvpD/RAD55 family RecA-like ATPase